MIVIGLVMLVIGILVGYILRKSIGEKTIGNAEQKAKNMILDAENRAETVKKELVLEAKEEAHRQRNDLETYQWFCDTYKLNNRFSFYNEEFRYFTKR